MPIFEIWQVLPSNEHLTISYFQPSCRSINLTYPGNHQKGLCQASACYYLEQAHAHLRLAVSFVNRRRIASLFRPTRMLHYYHGWTQGIYLHVGRHQGMAQHQYLIFRQMNNVAITTCAPFLFLNLKSYWCYC